jgi:hypothetical protein
MAHATCNFKVAARIPLPRHSPLPAGERVC